MFPSGVHRCELFSSHAYSAWLAQVALAAMFLYIMSKGVVSVDRQELLGGRLYVGKVIKDGFPWVPF